MPDPPGTEWFRQQTQQIQAPESARTKEIQKLNKEQIDALKFDTPVASSHDPGFWPHDLRGSPNPAYDPGFLNSLVGEDGVRVRRDLPGVTEYLNNLSKFLPDEYDIFDLEDGTISIIPRNKHPFVA
jgi:hypothetical protein